MQVETLADRLGAPRTQRDCWAVCVWCVLTRTQFQTKQLQSVSCFHSLVVYQLSCPLKKFTKTWEWLINLCVKEDPVFWCSPFIILINVINYIYIHVYSYFRESSLFWRSSSALKFKQSFQFWSTCFTAQSCCFQKLLACAVRVEPSCPSKSSW